jgi:hypothetical protein
MLSWVEKVAPRMIIASNGQKR